MLREDDAKLIAKATDIAITQDSRAGSVVCHCRLTFGDGLPENMVPAEALLDPSGGVDPATTAKTGLNYVRGEGIVTVDRLLCYRRQIPYETTEDLANLILDSLRDAAGSEEAYEEARRKVRMFCPDGAADEQLAGKLACEAGLPNMAFVCRCAAHAVHGVIRDAWSSDADLASLIKDVATEVAKFLRSSDRFRARFSSRIQTSIMAAVEHFNFAPQRFASKANTLARMIHFAKPVMVLLADEVEAPTTRDRRAWALNILRLLTGRTWLLFGMLADFGEDCLAFLRKYDARGIDPISTAVAVCKFRAFLRTAYVQQRLWEKPKTYTAAVTEMLAETSVLTAAGEFFVVEKPSRPVLVECMARVANVATACRELLDSQFPRFGVQQLFSCFLLPETVQAHAAAPEGECGQVILLARYLQWSKEQERELEREYRLAYPRVAARTVLKQCSSRDAWALELSGKPVTPLRSLLCLVLFFARRDRMRTVVFAGMATETKSHATWDTLRRAESPR